MNKNFYFTNGGNWVTMAKNGEVSLLREEIEKASLTIRDNSCNEITANNMADYLLDELRQNSHEEFSVVFRALEKKFVDAKDYTSLQMLSKYSGMEIAASQEAVSLSEHFEKMKATAESVFMDFYRGKETYGERQGVFFETDEPFTVKFADGELLFTADNGVEYRVFRIDYSEFGRVGF